MNKIVLILAFTLIAFSGCADWWSRGQPPSVETLISRKKSQLISTRKVRGTERKKVADISVKIETDILKTLSASSNAASSEESLAGLLKLREHFMALEGIVSVGSRAALGELSGQLRRFTENARNDRAPEYPAFGLFAARTFSFLENELVVPAPKS